MYKTSMAYLVMNYPITHVAIIWGNRQYSLPRPLRHGDVIKARVLVEGPRDPKDPYIKDVQGFLDSNGNFLNRYQAYVRVMLIKQHIVNPSALRGGRLFSEDVWKTEGDWRAAPGSPEYKLYWSTHSDEALMRLLQIKTLE